VTHGDLVHAMPAPRQQQNRDVRASDQQEQRGSREERRQNRDVRCASLLVDEQAQPNTEGARKSVRTAPGELLEQRLQLRLGDGHRRSRPHAHQHRHGRAVVAVHRQRQEEIAPLRILRRDDTDHRERLAIELQGLADGVGLAGEATLPEPVPQHRDAPRVWADWCIRFGEHATDDRLHAKQRERITRVTVR
jgi:hypothetical protein